MRSRAYQEKMKMQRGKTLFALGMILLLVLSLFPVNVYATRTYSSVTAVSGGGTFEEGETVRIHVSFTNANGGDIGGVIARVRFPKDLLEYRSTTMGPATYDGYLHPRGPELGLGDDLTNTTLINQDGLFYLGVYNNPGTQALTATITFRAKETGEGRVAVETRQAGWLDDDGESDFLRNSSDSTDVAIVEAAAEPSDPPKDDEEKDQDSSQEPGDDEDKDSEDQDSSGESGSGDEKDESDEREPSSDQGGDSAGGTGADETEKDEEKSQSGSDTDDDSEEQYSRPISELFTGRRDQRIDQEERQIQLMRDLTGITLPEGYELIQLEYDGAETDGGFHSTKELTILYFVESDGEGSFYLYPGEGLDIYPHVRIVSGERTYTLIPWYDGEEVPEGFEEVSLFLQGEGIPAWQNADEAQRDFFLVFAVNDGGERGLYQYDRLEGTLQRFVDNQGGPGDDDDEDEQEALPPEESRGFFQRLGDDRVLQGTVLIFSILTLLLIAAVLYFYQKSKEEKNSKENRRKNPSAAGENS